MDEQNEEMDLDTEYEDMDTDAEFTVGQRIVVGIGIGLVAVGMLLGIATAILFNVKGVETNDKVYLTSEGTIEVVKPLAEGTITKKYTDDPHYDDNGYCFEGYIIEYQGIRSGYGVTDTFYVRKDIWDKYEVGDHFVYSEEYCSRTNPVRIIVESHGGHHYYDGWYMGGR